jgi:Uma2 family endonuclease
MRLMSRQLTDEIVEASEHLPPDSTLIVQGVSWDDYENLVERLLGSRVQLSYDSGRLEIMSPGPQHAFSDHFISQLVLIFCETFEIDFDGFSNAIWTKKALLKGVQPDISFYVGETSRRKNFESEQETPPDIFVEIDVTHSSLSRFPIFAALKIPEVWRYDRNVCRFYALERNRYLEIEESRFLSGLTAGMINDAVEISKAKRQTEARRAFRRTVKAMRRKRST